MTYQPHQSEDTSLKTPTAEQLLDGAQFVQHRGGGQFRTCAEWDASGVFIPLSKWFALQRHLSSADGVAMREVPVTLEQVEAIAKTMWKGEPVPGRVLRFGAAVLGLADAAAWNRRAPDGVSEVPPIPEGYVLVPVKPTPAMVEVMLDWGTKRSEWEMILRAANPPTDGVKAIGLPERRQLPEREGSTYFRALGWNECLDEIAQRNAGVVTGGEGQR